MIAGHPYLAAAIAFVVLFVLDFIWAWYTLLVVAKRPYMSGFAAAAITACNGVGMTLIVNDPWMLIPTAIGAFMGTAVAVLWKS